MMSKNRPEAVAQILSINKGQKLCKSMSSMHCIRLHAFEFSNSSSHRFGDRHDKSPKNYFWQSRVNNSLVSTSLLLKVYVLNKY